MNRTEYVWHGARIMPGVWKPDVMAQIRARFPRRTQVLCLADQEAPTVPPMRLVLRCLRVCSIGTCRPHAPHTENRAAPSPPSDVPKRWRLHGGFLGSDLNPPPSPQLQPTPSAGPNVEEVRTGFGPNLVPDAPELFFFPKRPNMCVQNDQCDAHHFETRMLGYPGSQPGSPIRAPPRTPPPPNPPHRAHKV